MNILWFTWKDGSHPLAGGAEAVNEQLASRLVRDGHSVTFVVGGFKGGAAEESRNGYRIRRVGGRFTVYWQAYALYKRELSGTADVVIDEINTAPFFCRQYVREKNILFVHQLCRQVWFHEMWFPLSLFGYALEPVALRLLSDRSVITVSESTKIDLLRYGFRAENVHIIPEGVPTDIIENATVETKFEKPTLLSLGAIRSMKRTLDVLRIFEAAKLDVPDLQLTVAGAPAGSYGTRVVSALTTSTYAKDIRFLGRVTAEEKTRLMTSSHLLIVTSVKEGWGLVVTEANRRGTPALVYDVDGLRDSVRNGDTGIIVPDGDIEAAATEITRIIRDGAGYARMRNSALAWSKTLTPEASYDAFLTILSGT